MTSEVVLMNRQAVALAADSAVTISGAGYLKTYNSADKLFQLVEGQPVAVMIYHNAEIMNVPWETVISLYRDYAGGKPMATVEEYAEDFLAFISGNPDLFPADHQDVEYFKLVAVVYSVIAREFDLQVRRFVEAKAGERLLETGHWHHVAGVFDGREVRLYVDGRLAASRPGKGRRTTNRHPFYVGADPDRDGRPVDHLEGLVDEVRLSTKARYTGDGFRPPRRCDPDEHTLLLLHLDRDLGPFVVDASGHGRHPVRLPPATCAPLPDQR